MKYTDTYKALLEIRNDMLANHKASPAFKYLHQHKMNEFFNKNKVRIQIVLDKIKALENKYVKCDEHGNAITLERHDDRVSFGIGGFILITSSFFKPFVINTIP